MNDQAKQRRLRPHPTRDLILAALGASSSPLSPTQIAGIIGTSLGATAYHVRVLEKAGAVEMVDEGRVRGAVEHFFDVVPDSDYVAQDRASQLLAAFDALTVTNPLGRLTVVVLDDELRNDLDNLAAKMKPTVDRAVSKWMQRARRK